MSIVVVGGNDRMATRYKDICKSFKCKAKVFTQMPAVFTNTCSHKMVQRVNQRSAKYDIPVARIHSASVSALKNVLNQYCI